MIKRAVLKAIRGFVGRWGYQVRRDPSPVSHMDFYEVDLVVDVGANEGQFAQELRAAGYSGRIVSFEPIPDVHARLAEAARGDPLWDTHPLAIGAEPGRTEITVLADTRFSSMLPTRPVVADFAAMMAPVETCEVEVARLDDVAHLLPGERPYLKVDTQGFEQHVLAGAGELLDRCVGLQLELPLIHLYEGSWTFVDALSALEEKGLVPAQFHPVSFSAEEGYPWVEADCVFRRRNDQR